MSAVMEVIKRFVYDESGATVAEYAILAALIAVAAVAIVYALGQQLNAMFSETKECIVTPSACGS